MESIADFFQLGTDLDFVSSAAQTEEQTTAAGPREEAGEKPREKTGRKDFFVERDGMRFAGTHLIIDLYEAEGLDDRARIERAMRDCVEASGATLLHLHLHHFSPNGGISGVAVLAESHISIHSWPEYGYAALDVFMCGDARPHAAVEVLRAAFRPGRIVVGEHLRGDET